jgi:hypothetical protein
MKIAMVSAMIGLLLVTCASGAAYKEGKMVIGKNYKVDIVKMTWGMKDNATDRIVGTVRLYATKPEDVFNPIALTFDVFSKKAVAKEKTPAPAIGTSTLDNVGPQAEKIDTIDFTFDFHAYGYKFMRLYYEGDFCVEVAKNPEASRMTLCNVKVNGEPVTYQTVFNINATLNKTSFSPSEPKVVEVPIMKLTR